MIHLLDPRVIAELVGVDDLHADEPFSDGPRLLVAWAERTYPEAAAADHYGFAAVIWDQMGWSDPWSILDQQRPKDMEALSLLRRARGDPSMDVVQIINVDAQGRHAPAGHSLEEWTRWAFARLVDHYFLK